MAQREAGANPKKKPAAKKKAASKKAAPPVVALSNLKLPSRGEEESFRIWAGKIKSQLSNVTKAEKLLQGEKGSLSGIYTAAKEAGVPLERLRVLKKVLKEEQRDARERYNEARETAWQSKMLGSPVVQLGMFDGLLKPPTLEEYEMMGELAGRNGEAFEANAPTKVDSDEYVHYLSGWKKGQRIHAEGVFGTGTGEGEGEGEAAPEEPAPGMAGGGSGFVN